MVNILELQTTLKEVFSIKYYEVLQCKYLSFYVVSFINI